MLITDKELDERLVKRQIELLENASPECWHCAAVNHNWSYRLDILYWIVVQEKCDKATALLIFWKGEPTFYNFKESNEEMGEDSYSVEPMLKYIVRRFNEEGYQRSEIDFDIWVAKTGGGRSDPHGILPESYYSVVEAGIHRDFDDLIKRRDDKSDPKMKVPDDMLKFSIVGHDIGDFKDVCDFYYSFPVGVDYDTGEFVYIDRPSDEEDQTQIVSDHEAETASSAIRALRNQAKLTEASHTNNGDQRNSRVHRSVRENAGFLNMEREETWFFFNMICMGFWLIALLVYTSEKSYSNIGWVASVAFSMVAGWSAFSSYKKFDQSLNSRNLFGAITVGLFSGVFISLPAFACLVAMKASYGGVIGSLITITIILPLVWIISMIFDKSLRSAS